MNGILDLAEPVAGRAPTAYVPPHPVAPAPRPARAESARPCGNTPAPGVTASGSTCRISEKDIAKRGVRYGTRCAGPGTRHGRG